MNKKGLKSSRNAFWNLLRNKAYIGQVLIPAYKTEPAEWIKGLHEPLIDEETFYIGQDIIEGRKRKVPQTFKTIRDEFPLRGYLTCPQCGLSLTASSSRGRLGTLYPYYHCLKGCKERQKAEVVNEAFENLLKDLNFKPKRLELFRAVLKDKLKKNNGNCKSEMEKINKEIAKNNQRALNARTLMLDGEINPNEYKEIKIDIETSITNLTRDLNKLSNGVLNLDEKIDNCVNLLSNISNYYKQKDTATKQRIIGSIFPSKLIYEKSAVRTLEMNNVVSLIFFGGKAFEGIKKQKHTDFGVLSFRVVPPGLEPGTT